MDQPLAAALTKLTKLTDLRLSTSQSLQDQELALLLGRLDALQRLDLAECYKLTETGVKTLDFPLQLTALNLSRYATPVTLDTGVQGPGCEDEAAHAHAHA